MGMVEEGCEGRGYFKVHRFYNLLTTFHHSPPPFRFAFIVEVLQLSSVHRSSCTVQRSPFGIENSTVCQGTVVLLAIVFIIGNLWLDSIAFPETTALGASTDESEENSS